MTIDGRPILVVGAGPTGLTAAIELARRGFRPRIIDRNAERVTESRALGINARSLDILEPSGATARLLKAGLRIKGLTFHAPDRTLFTIDMASIPHRFNFLLVLPQSEIEALLERTLRDFGIGVERNTALVSLDPEPRPRAVMEGPSGREELEPGIVIGADGAHSAVRHALRLDFAGSAYETEWGLADVRVATSLPLDRVHIFDLSPVLLGLIPIQGDLVRLISDHADVLAHAPPDIAVGEIVWRTTFRISHRQADTYQQGRVFLAGDAAHIHSPVGARGMNLGIEDAAWLAWLIQSGRAGEYTSQRWPVAHRVLRTVDPATRFIASDRPLERFARRQVLPRLMRVPAVRRQALERIAALDTPAPPWLAGAKPAPQERRP